MGWEHIGSLQEGRCVCRYHVVGDSGVVRVLRVDCFSVDYQGGPETLLKKADWDDRRTSLGVVAVMWKFDFLEPRGTSY